MIPALSLLIGFYVVVKCADLLAASDTRWNSQLGASLVRILAILCTIATVYLAMQINSIGGSVGKAGLLP